MAYTIEHKTLGIKATIKELTQRDLESFGNAASKYSFKSTSQMRGSNVKSAIEAGWFSELIPALTVEQVGECSPAVIRLLGDWVGLIYTEVTTIPPN